MVNKAIVAVIAAGLSTTAVASSNDDPLLFKVMIDKFEAGFGDGSTPLEWDADAWVGYDLNKFWFKTEGEYVDGETESADMQFLYSRAIAPFWDFQVGYRRAFYPDADRDYGVLAFKGLAPYLFEVDADLFIGSSGQVGARLDAEYEYMFTQKLILSPEIELNLYSKDDPEIGIGSGLSDLELGLRLRYEIRREFAPYIGVNWSQKFGQTADYARDEGEDSSDVRFVAGIRAWF